MAQISKAVRKQCFKDLQKKCGPPAKARKCASNFLKTCLAKGRKK